MTCNLERHNNEKTKMNQLSKKGEIIISNAIVIILSSLNVELSLLHIAYKNKKN